MNHRTNHLTRLALGFGLLVPLTSCTGCLGAFSMRPNWDMKGELVADGRPAGELETSASGLMMNDESLHVTTVDERARFGVGLAAADEVPAPWRPDHIAGGGVVVTYLDATSPLRIAGVRPLDRIVAIAGTQLTDPAQATTVLGTLRSDEPVWVDVVRETGPERLELVPRDQLVDGTTLSIPFLFEVDTTATSSYFWFPEGALLGGVIFNRFAAISERPNRRDGPAFEPFVEGDLFEQSRWDTLLGLVEWRSVRRLRDGQTKRTLTLFWFFSIDV